MSDGPVNEAKCIIQAKRFKKQIFLSVNVPHSFLSMGNGQELLLEAERGIVVTLKEMEGAQTK